MRMIFWISAIGVALSLIYYAAATLAVIRFSQRTETDPPPLPKIAPRVVILKPLHGLSETLSDNVISYLELDYPRKEFVFGVADYTDGAATVPLGLKARYQFADIALSVGETANAANRKIVKLIKMSERLGRAEIVVLSDADIEIDRDHLRRVIGELTADEKTGVVTCIYRAKPMGGIGARFEAMFVNTDFLPMALLSQSIEPMRHA